MNEELEVDIEYGKSVLKKSQEDYSGHHGKYSIEATYAIIGANWAVFRETFFDNPFALLSVALCVFLISINIFILWKVGAMFRERYKEFEKFSIDQLIKREKEFKDIFPFSKGINSLTDKLALVKMIFPLMAGGSFILGILFKLLK
jgi:hypothetical protein